MDIVELIYCPTATQGPSKDYEFLHATMLRRWNQGLSDARASIASAPWLEPAPPEVAVRTFDVVSKERAKATGATRLKPLPRELTRQEATTHG
jgi:Patatin phospholipase